MTRATTFPRNAATLTCTACGDLFARTAAEQRYYDQRAAQPPETCPTCRTESRAARNAELKAAHETADRESLAPAVPRHSDREGARRGGTGAPGGGPGGEPRLFHAICADCGRPTEVPFRPRSGRPVFCRDCYNARRGR